MFLFSWASRIRTYECWNQNPVPYRLAIAQHSRTNSLIVAVLFVYACKHAFSSLLAQTSLLLMQQGWILGFEPRASRATIWRANQLRYTHHVEIRQNCISNVLEGIRTPDPRLRRPLLYPAELWTHWHLPLGK